MANSALQALLAGNKPAVSAAPATVAAAAPVALPDAGSSAANLKNLLQAFADKAAKSTVNPPEAQKVLETVTAPEAAGAPQPDEDAPEPAVAPPTTKPAAVLAAEQEKKTRRTAAIVQEELDAANVQIEALKEQLAGYAAKVREEFASETALLESDKAKVVARAEDLQAQLEDAVQMILALQNAQPAVIRAAPVGASTKDLADALAAQGFRVTLEVPAA